MSSGYVGGGLPTGSSVDAGPCAESCVCNALDSGLAAIVSALTQIDNTLAEQTKKSCTIVDDCKQEIIDLIDESFKRPVASCQDCQAMLSQGLGGTLEYAVACAGACASEIQSLQDSVASLESNVAALDVFAEEDTLADTYGQSLNIPPVPKSYTAWCSFEGGEVIVTLSSDPPPFENATAVAWGDDEKVVFEEGLNICKTYETVSPYSFSQDTVGSVGILSNTCDITNYSNANDLDAIMFRGAKSFQIGQLSESWKAIADLGLEGINLGNLGSIVAGIWGANWSSPPKVAEEFLPKISGALGCSSPLFTKGIEIITAIGMFEHFSGADLSEHMYPIKYATNAACRSKFSEPKDAVAAYLANAIDYATLDTHFAIDGLCPAAVEMAVKSEKSQLTEEHLIHARHRGVIDVASYNEGFRRLGYVDDFIPGIVFDISEHLPDANAVISMAQQGTNNNSLVEKYGLRQGENALSQGLYNEWFSGQGINQVTRNNLWESHWRTPNYSTLFTFLHRLRDDDSNPKFGLIEGDIRESLDSLGIVPYWQDHIMATAFEPLGKRDIRVAYTSGALPDSDIESALRKTGHDDESVGIIAKELKPLRRREIQTHLAIRNWIHQQIDATQVRQQLQNDGFDEQTIQQALTDAEVGFLHSTWAESYAKGLLPKQNFLSVLIAQGVSESGANSLADTLSWKIMDHQAVKNYMSATMTYQQAFSQMVNDGVQPTAATKMLNDANDNINNVFMIECVRGIEQRYLRGELDNEQVNSFLNGRIADNARVNAMVSSFDCKRKSDGTDVHVEKLCHWLYLGMLSPADFLSRLHTLGYSEENAAMLLEDCMQANTLKAINEAKKIAAEQQRDAEKVIKASEKANAVIDRQNQRLAAARAKQAKIRADRDRQMIMAAERLDKLTTEGLVAAIAAVRHSVGRAQSVYKLTLDEALQTALTASSKFGKGTTDEFINYVDTLADLASTSGNEPKIEDVGGIPTVNGDTQPESP